MQFLEGQGVFGKIRFRDGAMPAYNRPYLIVGIGADYIDALNVSSENGKVRKLAFQTNKKLRAYRPPFIKPSFVKLDSLTRVYSSDFSGLVLLDNGRTLDKIELEEIKSKIIR